MIYLRPLLLLLTFVVLAPITCALVLASIFNGFEWLIRLSDVFAGGDFFSVLNSDFLLLLSANVASIYTVFYLWAMVIKTLNKQVICLSAKFYYAIGLGIYCVCVLLLFTKNSNGIEFIPIIGIVLCFVICARLQLSFGARLEFGHSMTRTAIHAIENQSDS